MVAESAFDQNWWRKKSLVFNTLANMTFRLMLVVLVISAVSYWHFMSQLSHDTQAKLLGYITERGQREEATFVLAERNHEKLRRDFLEQFTAPSEIDWQQRFDRYFFRWPDGTIRNVPENTQPQSFDTWHYPTTFVQLGVKTDSFFQKRLALSHELVEQYGTGWQTSFIDTYISLPEGAVNVHMPGIPYGITAPTDYNIQAEEWVYLGDYVHNPERKTAWTGVYFDPVMDQWVVSAETPIDDEQGRHLGTIGHDIALTELIERTIDDHLSGTYNLLIRTDGQLIAVPELMEKIWSGAGKLTVQTAGDPHLQRVFEFATQMQQQDGVIYNSTDREYLAIAQLQGADWYLINVYPESLLREQALSATRFLFFLGITSLVVEVLLLFFVLRNKIATPLKGLLNATQQVTGGNFEVELDLQRQDELGQLATAFTQMTQQLQSAFTNLEEKIKQREQAEAVILEKSLALERALKELQSMQMQTVQNEKMATLGNLVAGIAHEINNPLGFLNGSIQNAKDYIRDLLEHLEIYQEYHPPDEPVQDNAEEIDLEFLSEDLPKLIDSMQAVTDRIKGISTSLRTFSRADTEYKVSANLHEGLDSTLLILKYRLKANEKRPAIEVIQDYGDLPLVECFPGQLNQVFMNILANAIDMFDEVAQRTSSAHWEENPPQIAIQTAYRPEQRMAEVRIGDNGKGMPDEVKNKIFDYLFTTKAVGKGTGLGMAISHQIVTETHAGMLSVQSEVGQGSEFIIQLPTGR